MSSRSQPRTDESQGTSLRGQPIVVSPVPVVARISPLGYHDFASQFLRAARAVVLSDRPFSPVACFLVCQSIELSLKAFLLIHHVPKPELKSLGHDLVKLLSRAQSLDLGALVSPTAEQQREVQAANRYYKGNVLRYFEVTEAVTGYEHKPRLEVLLSVASALVETLGQPCLSAT